MKIIEKLADKISEEIRDATRYAKLAVKYRADYPEVAKTLYDLSAEEMDHMGRLHTAVAGLIDQYRATNGDPPAAMQAVYDYLHKQQMIAANKARSIQAMYKDA